MDDESPIEKRPDVAPETARRPPARSAEPAPAAEMRASDADRDHYAEILREAMAEGRLTADEHGERIEAVYAARTLGELEPLVRDLPAPGRAESPRLSLRKDGDGAEAPLPEARSFSPQLVAIFGGAERKGRWRVPKRLDGFAMFGGIDLDFTDAVFEQREVTINIVTIFGGADIRVPENVTLQGGGGVGIFGGFDIKAHEAEDPNAPVVHVTGFALFGGVSARRKKGKRLKNLLGREEAGGRGRRELHHDWHEAHRELREAHREMREELRDRREERRDERRGRRRDW